MQYERKELMTRLSDYLRRGLTNQQIYDLVDSLWRDPYSPRTSGFDMAGGTDSEMSVDWGYLHGNDGFNMYIIFSIRPMRKKFKFYYYRKLLVLEKRQQEDTLHMLSGEGKFLVFYEKDQETNRFSLQFVRNPQRDERQDIVTYSVMVASIYWDAEAEKIIYFGDNRHGSLWNPWMHWPWHQTFNSMRETGLQFTNLVPDGDGTKDEHAQFGISPGTCFHEDIHATSEGKDAPASLPVWYFKTGSLPRIYDGSVNSLVINGTLCYNNNAITPADDGYFVFYHVFFTNDTLEPLISVMGQAQYSKVGEATALLPGELQTIRQLLPHENLLHIGSLLFQTSSAFGNSYHSRIITQTSGVITKWTTVGDGSPAHPVMVENDEPMPEAGKVYGTDYITGQKGWVNLDPRLFPSGQIIYLQSEDSDISGYKQATTVEPDGPAVSYSKNTIPLSGEQRIQKFSTVTGFPGTIIIPAGPWTFTIWGAVDTNDLCVMVVRVYKRDAGDVETELFNFSLNIMDVAFSQHLKTVPQNQIELSATDRLVVEYLFQNYGSNENTMYLAVEGNEAGEFWWSNVRLPLSKSSPMTFLELTDTPNSYTDQAGKVPVVNETEDGLEFVDFPENGGGTEDIAFDFNDVEEGISQTWVLDVKASFAYNILAVVLESDSTMDDMAIKIDGTAVGGMSAIDVTTGTNETSASSGNSVSIGSRVTMVSSGTDGAPTLIRGKLKIQRT